MSDLADLEPITPFPENTTFVRKKRRFMIWLPGPTMKMLYLGKLLFTLSTDRKHSSWDFSISWIGH